MNCISKIVACVTLLAFFACTDVSAAEVTKVGTTAAKFLSIPVGARALGMGGSFVALANDASAMYWNPAGIARINQSEAMFTHSSWLADISFNYGGVVAPLSDFGTVGVNFTSLSMGEMEVTTELQPDGNGQTFTAGSFAVGVSYARNLTEWFSIGANAKYIQEHIRNTSASGLAIDVGTLFNTPFTGLTFGAGISNFGQKMQLSGDDLLVQKDISPINGNNPNINANLSTEKFDLPLTLRIGIAYAPISTEDQQLMLVADAAHPNDNSESISFGGEYSVFQRILSLRGGYKALGASESEEQFTLGAGLQYSVAENLTVKVDYAFQKFGRLDSVQKFTVGILF